MPSIESPRRKNPLRHAVGDFLSKMKSAAARRAVLAGGSPADMEPMHRADWAQSVSDPTAFYRRGYRVFHRRFDPALRAHREYFTQEGRAFGEDAFHVMWKMIFEELKPRNFLEIGVFRGQTLSLIALLAKQAGQKCEVFGISPFNGGGDSACKYPTDLDYVEDIYGHFKRFGLPRSHLEKAYSTDPAARQLIESREWDLIYIDGNHDYDVVRSDWEICSRQVRVGGIIVMDDAGSRTNYQPPVFATRGFPDVSRLVEEIDHERFPLVLQMGHNLALERRS